MPNEHYIDGELLRIIDEAERVVVDVLTEAGIQPDRERYWDLLRQTKGRPNSSEGQAAAVFVEIQNLRDAVERDETKSAAYLAMTVMYRFMRSRHRFTWGVELEASRLQEEGRKRGRQKGNVAKKSKADEFWEPWEQRFRQLLREELGPYKARNIIHSEMKAKGPECERSESAIKRRLRS